MNRRLWLPLVTILTLTGCQSKPGSPATKFVAATPSLPRFRLVKVIPGNKDFFATKNSNLPTTIGSRSEHFYVPRIDRNYIQMADSLRKQMGGDLNNSPQIVIDEGEPVMVFPVSSSSDHFRFYGGPKGIYYRKRGESKIKRIYRNTAGFGAIRNDVFYTTRENGDGTFKIVKFGPKTPESIIADGVIGNILNVGPNEEILVGSANRTGLKLPGKAFQYLKLAAQIDLLEVNGKIMPVGVAWDGLFGTPAIWNDDLMPVRLGDLCPGLDKAIKKYDELAGSGVKINPDGTISFMIEGWNRITENTYHDPVAYTYVIEVEPQSKVN